jgi:hypothetical protein
MHGRRQRKEGEASVPGVLQKDANLINKANILNNNNNCYNYSTTYNNNN